MVADGDHIYPRLFLQVLRHGCEPAAACVDDIASHARTAFRLISQSGFVTCVPLFPATASASYTSADSLLAPFVVLFLVLAYVQGVP